MKLTRLALPVACAVSAAAWTSTQQVSASKGQPSRTARAIVGTSLIGARGATLADQEGIDDTVAGVCGAGVWTPEECLAHDQKAVGKRR
ncbi:hypothetical protein NOJ28_26560 [Neorhizobium galegae]|nr:hypothetical protein [Neorhizobium galegae]MCQ1769096.1 hypothetical protein [Neorhizobium galegae]MCQ1846261.1 hypothetical protein [Neorhizobium galegae]CDZ38055.1 Hypothetical protein NGAL_HAMBI1146_26800 [Neorhizobium galegae bv. officinalis]